MTLPDLQERYQNAIRPAAPDLEHRHAVRSSGTASGSMTQRGSVDTVRIIPAGSRPPDFPERIQTAIRTPERCQIFRNAVWIDDTARFVKKKHI